MFQFYLEEILKLDYKYQILSTINVTKYISYGSVLLKPSSYCNIKLLRWDVYFPF